MPYPIWIKYTVCNTPPAVTRWRCFLYRLSLSKDFFLCLGWFLCFPSAWSWCRRFSTLSRSGGFAYSFLRVSASPWPVAPMRQGHGCTAPQLPPPCGRLPYKCLHIGIIVLFERFGKSIQLFSDFLFCPLYLPVVVLYWSTFLVTLWSEIFQLKRASIGVI